MIVSLGNWYRTPHISIPEVKLSVLLFFSTSYIYFKFFLGQLKIIENLLYLKNMSITM